MSKFKTMKEISVELVRREGKKVSLTKAQIDECLAHLSDMILESSRPCYVGNPFRAAGVMGGLTVTLYNNGARRSKKKAGL